MLDDNPVSNYRISFYILIDYCILFTAQITLSSIIYLPLYYLSTLLLIKKVSAFKTKQVYMSHAFSIVCKQSFLKVPSARFAHFAYKLAFSTLRKLCLQTIAFSILYKLIRGCAPKPLLLYTH
jgi:hypothetical protein